MPTFVTKIDLCPLLQVLDRNGCVIYMSSFSCSIGPGLRLGYVVVPRDLIRAATTIKGLIDNGLPWLEQAALTQFIRDGSLVHHLKRLRHTYKARRDALVSALHRHFGAVDICAVEGGMHLLWRLPHDVSPAHEIQATARSQGVGVYPLQDSRAYLYEHMKDYERILLLGYTLLTEAQIELGNSEACRGNESITPDADKVIIPVLLGALSSCSLASSEFWLLALSQQ